MLSKICKIQLKVLSFIEHIVISVLLMSKLKTTYTFLPFRIATYSTYYAVAMLMAGGILMIIKGDPGWMV